MEFGTVFGWEGRRLSRQRWFYAARSMLVGVLLLGLSVVWWVAASRPELSRANELAKLGQWFFKAVAVGQISMGLFAAPPVTAGAFCN
jgi:hypothetical protein